MKKVCISKDWTFSCPEIQGKQSVDLPHDYVIGLKRDAAAPGGPSIGFFTGTRGAYTKYMQFGDEKHMILDIDGAYMCARIYLNDNLLDMHPYGYTPYLVDLSDKAWRGMSNKLSIDVSHLQPSSRWYSGSGIYRDVYLWTGGSVRIEPWDMFVTTKELNGNSAAINANMTVSADSDCDVKLTVKALDADGICVAEKSVDLGAKTGKNGCDVCLDIKNPKLWSCDTPYLYTLCTEVRANGQIEDTAEVTFGIRTISFDAKNGFLLNGEPTKLRGGCIHHDHGVLGSAEFPAAIHRKISLLKSVGYNAVRIAHNPPSLALLEVCDRLGMLVMDEAFDMWNVPKSNLDYSLWFRDWWQRDISYMVLRDRNHPCVISYSIGNEIPERDGSSDGAEWSEKLANAIREYDNTRAVTSGVCCIWFGIDKDAPVDYKVARMGGFDDVGNGTVKSSWGKRTEAYMKPLDIVGYNYLFERYANDAGEYPDRVIWGSETHAINFYDSWKAVLENPNVIGDFTWTAYDNLGEVGTGRYEWAEEGFVNTISFGDFPWRSCYQGDFDLCGYRRPQSYFREAIWKGDTEPHIFTTHPRHNGDDFSGTGWHWYDVADTWTFGDEYIGKPVKTDVYTTADEIVFILNGTEVCRATPEKGIATAFIPYEKGELTAVAVNGGKRDKSLTLKTAGEAYKIRVVSEKPQIAADNRDLCYFDIFIEDENGNRITDAETEIKCEIYGGELLGVCSGNPKNDDRYGSACCHTYEGRAIAIARSDNDGDLKIRVTAEGLKGGVGNIVKVIK